MRGSKRGGGGPASAGRPWLVVLCVQLSLHLLVARAAAASGGQPRDGAVAEEYACDERLRSAQEERFSVGESEFVLGCCDASALLHLYRAFDPSPNKVIVDIGANKGFSVYEYFHLWGNLAAETVAREYARGLAPICGLGDPRRPTVYAVEPSRANCDVLERLQAQFGANMHVLWMAASSEDGMVHFEDNYGEQGCELCHISERGRGVLTPVRRVDTLLGELGIDYVDYMKIDAEGWDPAVLDGMNGTLSRRAVGLFTFEHHRWGLWRERSLRDVTRTIAERGYECFLMTPGPFYKLTGGCWSERFEVRQWSNVACLLRTHPLLGPLALRFSVLSRFSAAS
eukprot:tig00021521_g22092.t1